MDKKLNEEHTTEKTIHKIQPWVSWAVTGVLVAVLVSILFWQPILARELAARNSEAEVIDVGPVSDPSVDALANMPFFTAAWDESFLVRYPETNTISPTRPRSGAVEYEVVSGDAVFSIAQKYNISPETVLWANYQVLSDDPHTLMPGQVLSIPPTDGILYEWKEGDTLENVARNYRASVDDILLWFGNKLDMTDPELEPGEIVMIPGGSREFIQPWVVPTIPVGRAGVDLNLPGSCEISGGLLGGAGYFIWPTQNRYLSGNDYWSGHLAIDIAAAGGHPIYAADSGVVVLAGWWGGYGRVILIDHLNGYQTLYAHLNTINIACGSTVHQGTVIGGAGSTGNSTGPHLHFEVRYMGGFINPWTVLP